MSDLRERLKRFIKQTGPKKAVMFFCDEHDQIVKRMEGRITRLNTSLECWESLGFEINKCLENGVKPNRHIMESLEYMIKQYQSQKTT